MPDKPSHDWLRALEAIKVIKQRPGIALATLVNERAAMDARRPALDNEIVQMSYGAFAGRINQYSCWALNEGFASGTVIGLLMPNCPDYAAIWLGLTQAGCIVALINAQQTGSTLVHAIAVAEASCMIIASSMSKKFIEIRDELSPTVQVWVHGELAEGSDPRVDIAIDDYPETPPEVPRTPASQDTALLIYTSGTTGLPKAAVVTHARLVEWSLWFAGMMNVQPNDRMYNCLPMYHSTGGVVAIGAMLVRGGSICIRQHFSASRFWQDVGEQKCTIFQYIGELCRYLVNTPAPPVTHQLRLCCGNGLRGDIWQTFQQRFQIPKILEFYASTEGNVSFYNCEGKPGAIGRIPPFLRDRFAVALIKCDLETGDVIRDADGYCVKCEIDEIGEAIGQVRDEQASVTRFDGYTDRTASSKKILVNVFSKNDRWFRTGDLMRIDATGYYYFVDRIGDTFRWKGENVSTAEVQAALGQCPGVMEAVVFGIEIPSHEGRAGMAAIIKNADFSFAALQDWMAAHLATYAWPVSIRICESLETTGTFKHKNGQLMRDGFINRSGSNDTWLFDRRKNCFLPYDDKLKDEILNGVRGIF